MAYKYEIGYALSGGFIKGFAHLGAMQALIEHDIKPDLLIGVSAGALAGAFFADGNDPYQCLEYFTGHTFRDLSRVAISKSGIFSLDVFEEFLKESLKSTRIEDLKIPLIIVATDLDHGKSILFRKGPLAERIVASCAMPIMFTPRIINGTTYVDGGILKNFPVSFIRKECQQVVGINVSPLQVSEYKKNLWNIALRSYHFIFKANALVDRELCDLLIEPYNLAEYSFRELEKAEEIFMHGYKIANETIDNNLNEFNQIWKLQLKR